MRFCSIASGSSGNCYLIQSDSTNILLDVGIAGKKIISRLAQRGVTLDDIDAILVTHEHVDHVKSLRMIGKKAVNARVYGSTGTLEAVEDKLCHDRAVRIAGGQELELGDIKVIPFVVSHDAAEPLGYAFVHNGRKLVIATDTGYITEEIMEQTETADAIVLEANHEENILKMGSYPYSLKRRILGREGHLSNEAAGQCICNVIRCRKCRDCGEEPLKVVLAHLSNENNTPAQAYLTIKNVLFESDLYIDKDICIEVIPRDDVSEFMEV